MSVAKQYTDSILTMIIISLIVFNVLLAVSINYDFYGRNQNVVTTSSLASDYFDVIDPWGAVEFIDQRNSLGVDLAQANWFTYENLLGQDKEPNLGTAITDAEEGFSHLSPAQDCIDTDQLVFRRAQRTCNGKGTAECIGYFGDRFSRDSQEIYNYSDAPPLCSGTLGSLTFNFYQRDNRSSVSSGTRFMTIESIFVSDDNFAAYDSSSTNQFYTRQGQLFKTSSVFTLTDTQFYPLIKFVGKETRNFKQTLKLDRFSYINGEYVSDENGPYAEIFFRPQSLYLNAELNSSENQIDQFSVVDLDNEEWISGLESIYKNGNTIRRIYQDDGITLIDTTCTCQIIDTNVNLSIYKKGDNDLSSLTFLRIEADDGSKPLRIEIESLTNFSIFFIFEQTTTPKKWLLIPPLDIGGGKVIPTDDRSYYMRILNAPPLLESSYLFARSRGKTKRDGDSLRQSLDGRQPLTTFVEGLFTNQELSISPGKKVLFRTFKEVRPGSNDEDLLPVEVEGFPIWWNMAEYTVESRPGGPDRNQGLFISNLTFDDDDLMTNNLSRSRLASGNTVALNRNANGEIRGFKNNFFENYLLAIGEDDGNVDETDSPFYSVQPYLGWKFERHEQPFYKKEQWKSMLSFLDVKYNNLDISDGNRFLDGNVIWQVVDPRDEIRVFSSFYFLFATDFGNSVSDFEETGIEYTGFYRGPVQGRVKQVFFNNYDYGENQVSTTINRTGLTLIGGGDDATVDITIINGILRAVSVVERGSNYTSTSTYSLAFQFTPDGATEPLDVVINNLYVDAEDVEYTYLAIPQSGNGVPFFNLTDSDVIIRSNFELDPSKIEVTNGKISLTDKPENCILSGGSGYKLDVRRTIYVDQLDQNGISVLTGTREESLFYSIRPTLLDTDTETIKTLSLISFLQTTPILPEYFQYNFYQNPSDSLEYGKSPQQIGYINDDDITDFITVGDETEFKNYLFRNSSSSITSSVGIFTLQFQRLNYRQKPDPVDGVVTLDNTIGNRENLVIGKFIPYSSYYSENPSDDFDYEIYNANDCQFVPNAISNIYTRVIAENEIPEF
jgi:hypothetical protein